MAEFFKKAFNRLATEVAPNIPALQLRELNPAELQAKAEAKAVAKERDRAAIAAYKASPAAANSRKASPSKGLAVNRGRKVMGAMIQNGMGISNVSIYDGGYVKIGGKFEKLRGISGDTQVNKKTGLGRSVATLATFATIAPGFNLLSPGQRGRISMVIVTDKRTHLFATDQVNEAAVAAYQKLVGAGSAVLQQIQLSQLSAAPPVVSDFDLGLQLKQISELHIQGILSNEEFTAAKAKLLGTT
jgi:hypothetical protein